MDMSMDMLETKSFERLFSGSDSGGGASDLSTMVSPRLLKSIYQSEDWIYILVDKIASKLAQIPGRFNANRFKMAKRYFRQHLGTQSRKCWTSQTRCKPHTVSSML